MQQYKDLIQHILDTGIEKTDRTGVGTLSTFGYQSRYDLSKGFPMVTIKRTAFRLIAEELLWFISGSDNVKPLIDKNVHIWDEWALNNWFESEEYKEAGLPDMTNFGLRAENDPEFKKTYLEMKEQFCQRITNEDGFAKKYGSLGRPYGVQWRRWQTYQWEIHGEILKSHNLVRKEIDQLQWIIDEIKRNPDSRRLILSAWNPAELDQVALPPCHSFIQFYVLNGKLSCQLYQR